MPLTQAEQTELFIINLKELLPSLCRGNDKQLISKVGKERFEEAVDLTFPYLTKACGELSLRNEVLALLSKVFKCLSDYIVDDLGLPVTPKTFFDNAYLLSYAVDRSFPGYGSAGLLKAIIRPATLSSLDTYGFELPLAS